MGAMWSAGLLALAALALPSPAAAAFGFESLRSTMTGAGGETGSLLAGSHPESWTTTLAFNADGLPGERHPEGSPKDLRVELPVGLAAVPALLPQCPHAAFLENACPASSAVGSIEIEKDGTLPATVFLLEPSPGQAAQLGFHGEQVPVTLDISISSRPPYGLIVSVTNIIQVVELFGLTLTLEGSPHGTAFIVLPRSCATPMQIGFTASSWQSPAAAVLGTAPDPQGLVGCESLGYSPSLKVVPTTTDVASPSGIDITLDAPDEGISSASGRAAADTQAVSLTLPPGLTINPPVAAGLTACSAAQLAAEVSGSEPGQGCPGAAKLGTATVTTPLFSKSISGSIYLTGPDGSSAVSSGLSGDHFTLALVLREAERGIRVSLPIQVEADPRTGRLTASLEQVPQLPVSHVELRFNSGPRAPLVTPASCGTRAFTYALAPSSGNPPVTGSGAFTTASPECSAPFAPSLSAGTVSNAAGRSSAFVFELTQDAAAPGLAGARITLPPGLSASFAAASACPEDRVGSGDCPADSRLGYARIALGAGSEPLWIPAGPEPGSSVYLAGPYKGAPYSLLIVVPAEAGPFDLGTVILRAPVTVDPVTAQAGLSLEGGLPQVLGGVPLRYRTVRVVLDRPGFIRNPTSCEPMTITGSAQAVDGRDASFASPFQAGNCAALSFRPRLGLRFAGALGRNGHPSARAVLRADPEGAALKSARFSFPAGELLDLRHLRALCPRTAAVGDCPRTSRLGSIRLYSPSLEAPLEGTINLRVPSHRLPDLVAEVRSGDLRFLLRGRTTLSGGRTGVALQALPDIPLSRAVLTLAGGRNGILVNSASLCRKRGYSEASFDAHNGRRRHLRVPVVVHGCR